MRTVILAGGPGTRIRPLSIGEPKLLMRVAGKRIIDMLFAQLLRFDYTDITITTHYLRDEIVRYVQEHWWQLDVQFPEEPQPLGTAGSVKNAHINDQMLVIQGDAVMDGVDLPAMVAYHNTHSGGATIGLKRVEDASEYGAVDCNELGRVVCFQEKARNPEFHVVNTGIYVLEPWVMQYVPDDRPFDFARDLFPVLIDRGELYAYEFKSGFWIDVGTPEGFYAALDYLNTAYYQ